MRHDQFRQRQTLESGLSLLIHFRPGNVYVKGSNFVQSKIPTSALGSSVITLVLFAYGLKPPASTPTALGLIMSAITPAATGH